MTYDISGQGSLSGSGECCTGELIIFQYWHIGLVRVQIVINSQV